MRPNLKVGYLYLAIFQRSWHNFSSFSVLQHKNIVNIRETNEKPVARLVQIPSPPASIAASCDGSLLGVTYIHNASSMLAVYHIPSFLTPVSL